MFFCYKDESGAFGLEYFNSNSFEFDIIITSMPYINRNINLHNQPQPVYQLVKQEPIQSDLLESPMLEESKQLAEGKWTQQQNLKFVVFVSYYQDIFSSKHKRKVCKIFKTFEEYLQGRTAAQCRSHFQKIIIKFKTVAKLRKFYQNHYGKDLFREELERFKTNWQETHPPLLSKQMCVREYKEFGIQTEQEPIINEQPLCFKCTSVPQQQNTLHSVPANFNQFLYWNQLQQQNLGYYCYVPMQSQSPLQYN